MEFDEFKIAIITDDSGVKLPIVDKWSGKIKKGIHIKDDSIILSLLHKYNLDIPTDDVQNEELYREILKEYIRPSKLMFSGMFSEIRTFSNKLSELAITHIYIISGRYGLLEENEKIIPYSKNIQNIDELQILDQNTRFSQQLIELTKEYSVLIFLLPQRYINYLIVEGFFGLIPNNFPLIIVTSSQSEKGLSNFPNFNILKRIGVARIGIDNQYRIIELIKNMQIELL